MRSFRDEFKQNGPMVCGFRKVCPLKVALDEFSAKELLGTKYKIREILTYWGLFSAVQDTWGFTYGFLRYWEVHPYRRLIY